MNRTKGFCQKIYASNSGKQLIVSPQKYDIEGIAQAQFLRSFCEGLKKALSLRRIDQNISQLFTEKLHGLSSAAAQIWIKFRISSEILSTWKIIYFLRRSYRA